MQIALCKCGYDAGDHYVQDDDHEFDASGTKHPCGEMVQGFHCPRPRYHIEYGVSCGPLTGKKLW